jgi:hypothetical protein
MPEGWSSEYARKGHPAKGVPLLFEIVLVGKGTLSLIDARKYRGAKDAGKWRLAKKAYLGKMVNRYRFTIFSDISLLSIFAGRISLLTPGRMD